MIIRKQTFGIFLIRILLHKSDLSYFLVLVMLGESILTSPSSIKTFLFDPTDYF